MSYANTVNLITMEGGSWPPVTARLWMLWTVLGQGSGSGPQQQEEGSDAVASTNSFPFSFALGPSFSDVSRGIGVSLQDTPRVANDTGWWFRSGRFEAALPTAPIEVVLLSPIAVSRADFAAALPPLPITMSPTRRITFLSVISGTELVATAAGTTTEALGVPIAFTCRLEISLSPAGNIAAPETELFTLGFPHPPLVTFSTPATDPVSLAAVAALNGLSGLQHDYADFVAKAILPGFVSRLGARYVALALGSLAGLIAPGTTTLPTGVVASLRTVEVTGSGLTVRGALGAFGGVFSKLPPPPPPTTTPPSRCFIATAATSESSPDVIALRAFRDTTLLPNPLGARLVRLYEASSPPLAKQIRSHPALRALVRHTVVRPAAALARLVARRSRST